MRGGFLKGVALGAVVSTLVLAATSALAGTGIGAVFNLGQTNEVDQQTTLRGSTSGKTLQVTNFGAGSGLGIDVGVGKPPITVNARAGKATYLNVDKLDGIDSTSFVRVGRPVNATATTGNGVQGSSSDAGASGVYGQNTGAGGYGVAGRAGAGGIGLFGDNTGGGWSGYFTGKIHVEGALDCAGCVDAAALAPGAGNKVGGYQLVQASSPDDMVVRTERDLLVSCPLGKMALGGGGWVAPHPLATTAKAAIIESTPAIYYPPGGGAPQPYGWYIKGKAMSDPYNTTINLGVYAICANVSP